MQVQKSHYMSYPHVSVVSAKLLVRRTSERQICRMMQFHHLFKSSIFWFSSMSSEIFRMQILIWFFLFWNCTGISLYNKVINANNQLAQKKKTLKIVTLSNNNGAIQKLGQNKSRHTAKMKFDESWQWISRFYKERSGNAHYENESYHIW
jgi:hypothetical protein